MSDWIKLSSPEYDNVATAAMLEALAPGQLDPTAWCRAAETALAQFLNVPRDQVLLTSSCTAALHIATVMLSQHDGQVVEAPVFTWPSTYSHAQHRNLVDTDAGAWPIWSDREDVLRIVVSLWGRPIPARCLAAPGGPFILDAAHSFGYGLDLLAQGRVAAVCYSFGPQKEVPCVRGGAVVSPHITPAWRALAHSGTLDRYGVMERGWNYTMPEPFAAMLPRQLDLVEQRKALRRATMRSYISDPDIRSLSYVSPEDASGHLMVLEARDETERTRWAGNLLTNRIECGIHYQMPAWLPPAKFPTAWGLSRRVLSVPLHTHLTPTDVERVVKAIRSSL